VSGGGDVISTDDGTVAINLDGIAELAVARVESRGISLPNLDIEFGELVLYESDQLAAVQTTARAIDKAGWLVPIVALMLIAISLWIAPDRRRMTSFLGFGTALGLLIALAAMRTGRNAIVGSIREEIPRDAGLVVWGAVTDLFVRAAWVLLAISFVIGFIAWIMGPSRHAKSLSRWTRSTIDRWGQSERSEPDALGDFFTQWGRVLEVGVVVLAVLFVLFGPAPTGLSVLATAIIAGAFIGAIEIAAGPSHDVDSTIEIDADSTS
jgi:hypothetical protein